MPKTPFKTSLLTRNVIVQGRRTSIRLGPKMWEALDRIAEREGVSLCEVMNEAKSLIIALGASHSSGERVYGERIG